MKVNMWSAQDIRRAAKELLDVGQQNKAMDLLLTARHLDRVDGTGYTGYFPPEESFKFGRYYRFQDGVFRFYVAIYETRGIIFRVREFVDVLDRAKEKGIPEDGRYGFRHATRQEIIWWLLEHEGYPMLEQLK